MKSIKVMAGLVVLCLLTACNAAPAEEPTPTPAPPTESPEQQQRTELPEPSNQKLLMINEKFLAIPASENITFYESLSGENTIPDPRNRDQFTLFYKCIYVAEYFSGISKVKGGDLSYYITAKGNSRVTISLAPDYYCKTADLQKIDLLDYLFSVPSNLKINRIEFNDGSYLLSIENFNKYISWYSTFYFDADGRIITVFPNINVKYAYKYDWNEDGIEDLFFLTGFWRTEIAHQIVVRNAEEDRKTLNTEYVDPILFDNFMVYMSSKGSSIDFSIYGVFPVENYKPNGYDGDLQVNPFYSMETLTEYTSYYLYMVGTNDFPTE